RRRAGGHRRERRRAQGRAMSDRDDAEADLVTFERRALRSFLDRDSTYVLTRFVLLRWLGLVYFFAFLSLALQYRALLGEPGVLPASLFLHRVAHALGSKGAAFWRLPSLFWLGSSDGTMIAFAWIGVALSALVCAGLTNAIALAVLWAIYLS